MSTGKSRDACSATFIKTTETTGLKKRKQGCHVAIQLTFSPYFFSVFFFLFFSWLNLHGLGFIFIFKYNSRHSSVSSENKAAGWNERLFHVDTFEPGDSVDGQAPNFRKQKKRTDLVVSREWRDETKAIGSGRALCCRDVLFEGAVEVQGLAWERWRDKLRTLWAPSCRTLPS